LVKGDLIRVELLLEFARKKAKVFATSNGGAKNDNLLTLAFGDITKGTIDSGYGLARACTTQSQEDVMVLIEANHLSLTPGLGGEVNRERSGARRPTEGR
jgi:hypothetical protein